MEEDGRQPEEGAVCLESANGQDPQMMGRLICAGYDLAPSSRYWR